MVRIVSAIDPPSLRECDAGVRSRAPASASSRARRAERVDAARNREAILGAARRLFAERGPASITMDRLAGAAGVGKGTLFRRFGDRAGLFHALLDETERRLQEGFIRGPAPLGPGAPARERLIAFGHALLELTAERGELLLAATPAARARATPARSIARLPRAPRQPARATLDRRTGRLPRRRAAGGARARASSLHQPAGGAPSSTNSRRIGASWCAALSPGPLIRQL